MSRKTDANREIINSMIKKLVLLTNERRKVLFSVNFRKQHFRYRFKTEISRLKANQKRRRDIWLGHANKIIHKLDSDMIALENAGLALTGSRTAYLKARADWNKENLANYPSNRTDGSPMIPGIGPVVRTVTLFKKDESDGDEIPDNDVVAAMEENVESPILEVDDVEESDDVDEKVVGSEESI